MSITLIRHKDGKEIPIKVSILDAFRSAPIRKPKAVLPQKEPNSKPSEAKVVRFEVTNGDTAKDNDNKAKNFSEHERESYSAEDDAKVIAMKDENKPWKQIKEAIGKKSELQLKNHYKLHLGLKVEEEQKKLAEKIVKGEQNKAESLTKQAESHGKKGGADDCGGGGGGTSGGADGEAAQGGKDKSQEKEKAAEAKMEKSKGSDTPESLARQNLQNFLKKYERDKWLAAASRHYDLTGQRISPETARRMAGQK